MAFTGSLFLITINCGMCFRSLQPVFRSVAIWGVSMVLVEKMRSEWFAGVVVLKRTIARVSFACAPIVLMFAVIAGYVLTASHWFHAWQFMS